MAYKEKRKSEKDKRRQDRMDEILEAAETLFKERGIKDSKMIDIARQCELSKGSLYFYFKSKDEIVWNLLKKHSLFEFSAGKEYIDGLRGDGYSKLKAYFDLFSEEIIKTYTTTNMSYQYREYMMSMFSEGRASQEVKQEFSVLFDRNLTTVVSLIALGQTDGSIRKDVDADEIGRGIGIAFGAYFRQLVGLKTAFDKEHYQKRVSEFTAYNNLILSSLKTMK